ncbi:uncharacterized protein LOC143596106 [Bidens hawaiensis]|uniref:uncharacterized protein LOC143596106 n=1 Tax=Bidens hawaiensis TaxID=980011 RepID=UPI0040491EF2
MAIIEKETGSSSQEQSTPLNDIWYMDSGCSRHMTCDKRSLVNYEEKYEGPVAFGSDENGGKIAGKGILTNGKVSFDNVFHVDGLQYNLLSISQMCDKGYKVSFDDSHCFILKPEFVIPPEMIMMMAPINGNLYELNMKEAVSRGGACFVSKAIENESKLWHRKLCHVNLKNMNRIVKDMAEDQPKNVFEPKHNMCALLQPKYVFGQMSALRSLNALTSTEIIHWNSGDLQNSLRTSMERESKQLLQDKKST